MRNIKLSPRVDVAFKKLFGVEENKDLLISLINSIVCAEDQVVDVVLLNPYNVQNFAQDKLSILDVKAKGVTGKLYNIEIQIANDQSYDKRALYYWAKLYTQQLGPADRYNRLNKAIGIHILNFTCVPESEKYHNVFKVLEQETYLPYFKDMEIHTIELSKFEERLEQGSAATPLDCLMELVKTALDKWVAFLTSYHVLENSDGPLAMDEDVKKALDVLETMTLSDQELDFYENHLKWLRDQEGALETRFLEGREEGSQLKALEIAKAMLTKGMDVKTVADLTGLHIDILQNLTQ
jgi:predicted transposase/invertase (TIGR01784 family)